nr:hypothetical protein [Mycobacterium shottsii]
MTASRLVGSNPRTPFGRMVTQGSFYSAGMQMGSGAVVLPVICAHQGLTWVAGLLFPAFSIGAILGNSVSPLILQRFGQYRHLLMAAISASAATLILANAAVPWTGALVAAVFFVTATASGVVAGVSGGAYTDMISNKLSVLRRGELLLTQGAVGSLLATGVTLVIVPRLAHGDEMARYHDLLWLGAASMIVAGVAALFVGPMRSASSDPPSGCRCAISTVRASRSHAASHGSVGMRPPICCSLPSAWAPRSSACAPPSRAAACTSW